MKPFRVKNGLVLGPNGEGYRATNEGGEHDAEALAECMNEAFAMGREKPKTSIGHDVDHFYKDFPNTEAAATPDYAHPKLRPMRAFLVTVQIEGERDHRVIDSRVWDGPEVEQRASNEGLRVACAYAGCSMQYAKVVSIKEVPNKPFTSPMGA